MHKYGTEAQDGGGLASEKWYSHICVYSCSVTEVVLGKKKEVWMRTESESPGNPIVWAVGCSNRAMHNGASTGQGK